MAVVREKFATQVDAKRLESARELAKPKGRQTHALAEDALREHLEAKQSPRPQGREHVMEAYLKSTERYPGLYKKLAQ